MWAHYGYADLGYSFYKIRCFAFPSRGGIYLYIVGIIL